MKNLIYILLFAFIISSCNKDDKKEDPELNIPFELVGKWKVTKRFITEGGPHYWMDYDTGCEWDDWYQNSGKFIECYPKNLNCTPHVGNFNITDNDIIINRENYCIKDSPSITTLTIDKLSNDTLIYDTHFWEGEKILLVKVNNVSDSCKCQ